MNIFLVILITTLLVSYKGFNDAGFFHQYKFSVIDVKRKNYNTLITSGFLHVDWTHLIFNMLSLYFFSNVVSLFFGDFGFLILYLGSIVAGNYFSYIIYKNVSYYNAVGASGGVSGIVFAAIALAPLEIRVNFMPGWMFAFLYFAYSVYMMFHSKTQTNIGHAAHLGGALFGFLSAFLLYPELFKINLVYIFVMSLPLVYMGYRIFKNK